ncbi:low molecular weight protein-tyrosine-phosphatase [Frigidibacter sp. MR17.24]|uniref:low molecular weight protein-tyrosine-phosphatase n=1 Tax=Frigidibacter sp. MR17.24 TaxID=3127345 RepID=UPI0030131A6A
MSHDASSPDTAILFVCLGNICRSPAAEAAMRARAAAAGLRLALDSAGTGDWHAGEPPHPPMIAAAARRGYDLAPLRARQVTRADFDRFDLILAMDGDNLANLRRIAPAGARARIAAFLPGGDAVPDPYFTGDFDGALDRVEEGVAHWLAELGAR